MVTPRTVQISPNADRLIADHDWMSLPGGELEAPRPRTLCADCRERLKKAAAGRSGARPGQSSQKPLCFGCYRAELDRQRLLKAAGQLDTATEARFQEALPFEPVNHVRLNELKQRRAEVRAVARTGAARFVDRRRHAQIAARRALEGIAEGLRARGVRMPERHARSMAAVHAAELQLPDAWIPYVVSR